jgi:predicted nucleic acid-binding protein
VNLFVDTSVWSLVLRRDHASHVPEAIRLREALEQGDTLVTTGMVLQELLQGVNGPRQRTLLEERFAALPFIVPDRDDHVRAADLHSTARRKGVQVGTVDALLASLCVRHDLTMLSSDEDFLQLAGVSDLKIWTP